MESASSTLSSTAAPAVRRLAELAAPTSPLWLLGHKARALVTPAGAGASLYDGLAVTRYSDDPTRDADGSFLYLRDLDDGAVWSAGVQPTAATPASLELQFAPGVARWERTDRDIRLQVEVVVCPETDVELRRYTLTNLDRRPRNIEFTSYLEWVLQSAAADAAHPAFSKLFVETEICAASARVLARRRPRDPRDATLAAAHALVACDGAVDRQALQFETSRTAFIGRGRTLRAPAALDPGARLLGVSGPVLDPIASLRGVFCLASNESASITLALAARPTPESVAAALASWSSASVDDAIHRAARLAAELADGALADGAPVAEGDGAFRRHDPPHRRAPLEEPAPRLVRLVETPHGGDSAVPLQFDNGLGGFAADGREYVLRLRPDSAGRLRLPPTPWSHVVANPQAGFIATETGGGSSWTVNSRENRLTVWANDPVSDPPSETIYLCDRARGAYWSPTPAPAGPGVEHEVRYAFGSVQYRQTSAALRQTVQQFVPCDDPVKMTRLVLENQTHQPRELDVYYFAHLALGHGGADQRRGVRTWFDEASGLLLAVNERRTLGDRVAFAAIVAPGQPTERTWTGDREEFLGRYGEPSAPAAVAAGAALAGRGGAGLDACAALQMRLLVPAEGAATCWMLLGEAYDEEAARQLAARYQTAAAVDGALAEVRNFWDEALSAVQVETPSPALDVMVNGWLPYQDLCCRLWARSAYYQGGGAFGFRDQLQDAAALTYHDPAITRTQILRHAAAQFVEGDVLHWWHPPDSRGVRTRFADDLLWLPWVAAEYAATTGDEGIWDEPTPWQTAPQLEPGEMERYLTPEPTGESAPLYEHACRAIDRSLAVGAHGLPLMGCGDWNDGMNCVGAGGRGESVWMAFFLDDVLTRMLPVCARRGDQSRVAAYEAHQRQLRAAVHEHGWDGQWFRRAYFDDGTPLGTAAAGECQIDALVQAWAVLSGAADPERARQGVAAVERRLVRDELGLIQLLDPPFDQMNPNPGYIKGYVPGVRENGGQYTHGVLWYVRALAQLGRGNRAVELLDMLNPIHHSRTPSDTAVYQVEPYVVAADVYSQPPHAGRGGWTWYTGSAGWMLRVALESILGLGIRGGRELVLRPCISASWPSCRVQYRLPGGGAYDIVIDNPAGRESGVSRAEVDGAPAAIDDDGSARIPLVDDGRRRTVRLQL